MDSYTTTPLAADQAVKPIDTRYGGHLFRSRTEARWAVFFDAAGIRYQYEVEGFELPGGERYLRDFWLPDLDIMFEVKGVHPDPAYCRKLGRFAEAMGKTFLIAVGAPTARGNVHLVSPAEPHGLLPPPNEAGYAIAEDRRIEGTLWLVREDHAFSLSGDASDRWPVIPPKLRRAYAAATEARFEHGG